MNDFDKLQIDAEYPETNVSQDAQHQTVLKGSESGNVLSDQARIDAQQLIVQILDDLLPYIASHGGHVEFVALRDTIVFIKFSGTCVQCPLSFYTVTYGIERHIKAKIDWILRVEVVED